MTDEEIRPVLKRRTALKTIGAGTIAGLAGCVGDEPDEEPGEATDPPDEDEDYDYPQESIDWIIYAGPGGGYDTYSRAIADHMPRHLPNEVPIVPENMEGAGGRRAMDYIHNSEPDGYTIGIMNVVSFPQMQVNFDVEYDIENVSYIGQIVSEGRSIAVAEHTGITTFAEYVDAVDDGELRFYSVGLGDNNSVIPAVVGEVGELYSADDVLDNLVVYDGRGEGAAGIEREEVEVMPGGYFSLEPYLDDPGLNLILSITTDDSPADPRPDYETLVTADPQPENPEAIQGMAGNIRAVGGPPDIPDDRLEILREAFHDTIMDEEFRSYMDELDRPLEYGDAEHIRNIMVGALNEWRDRPELTDAITGE